MMTWQLTLKGKPYGKKYGTMDEMLQVFLKVQPCLYYVGWKKVSQ